MFRIIAVVAAAIWVGLCGGYHCEAADKTPEQMVREAKAAIREVSVADVKKMLDAKDTVIILDVRDRHEFDEGHLPGSINISRGSLEFKVTLTIPDKSERIIVLCALDLRGPLATRSLNELGYKNAVNMNGGLKAWKEAGYPMSK